MAIPILLTKQQVADILHVSVYTIDAWVSQRKNLAFKKVGRKVMFDEADVLEYLHRVTVSPKETINN